MRGPSLLLVLLPWIAVGCTEPPKSTATPPSSSASEPTPSTTPSTAPSVETNAEGPTEAQPQPAAGSGASAAPAAPKQIAPHLGCTEDSDCVASCAHGAVNAKWHRLQYPGGESCEDGCTRKGTDPPRCEWGACVSYHLGKKDAECTGLDRPVIPGPGPAHRCNSDEDCTRTCALGAVNRAWLATQTDPLRCKGGCTAKGTDPPRCERNLCVAYHAGKRDESCTQKPIP